MSHATTVDIQDFLDRYPFSPFQWMVFGVCLVIVLLVVLWTAWNDNLGLIAGWRMVAVP